VRPVHATDLAHAAPLGRGKRSNETRLRLDERAKLLREAARFFPGASDREVARRLHEALSRYGAGAWRRERACEVCPLRHRDKLAEMLWAIFKVYDHTPSEGTVRAALARKGNPGFR
jgi:hypothetical protein